MSHISHKLSIISAAAVLVCVGAVHAHDLHAGHAHAQELEKSRHKLADAQTSQQAALPHVTVTATRSEEDARTAPASVTVFDRQTLQQSSRPDDDLLSMIEDAPGLTLSARQVGGRKTFTLRGMNDSHTLVLMDGRRIAASDDVVGHSDYQYGWVPASAIERVEVIRGPLSALYGSEALGGVVNVITRWPTDKWEGSVSLSGQRASNHQWGGTGSKVAAYASGPVAPGLALRFNAERNHVGPVASREDAGQSEIEGRKGTSGSLSARYALDARHTFEAGVQHGSEDRFHDTATRARPPVPYRNTYKVNRDHAYGQWNGAFDNDVKAQLRAYRSAIGVSTHRTNGVAPTRPQDMRDVVGDGFVQWRVGDHRLTAGGEWRRETLINSGLKGGKDSATHKALFAQDEFPLASHLIATAGVRLDHHEVFGKHVSPRAYLVWEPSEHLVVKGGIGGAFKAPTLKQISPNYVGAEGPHTFHGNANVKPESSTSFEAGADYTAGPIALRGTLFHTRVKDLIYAREIGRQTTGRITRIIYRYDNVDRATMRGAELGLTWAFAPGLRWNNDLTLLRTKDGRTGIELNGRPRQILHSQLQWRGAWGLNARLGLDYTGRARLNRAGQRLPAYTVFNLSVGQQINKMLSWRAGLDNVGNVRLADKSADFGYAIRGRTLALNVRAEF